MPICPSRRESAPRHGMWIAWLMPLLASGPLLAAEPVRFNREVLPILAEHCFSCHGFDQAKREAGLRLDSHRSATSRLESGRRAIVPGMVEQSELLTRITAPEEDLRMPPSHTNAKLSDAQIATLRRWVSEGAEYEAHWASIPPRLTEPPRVSGAEHPIDRFIRAPLAIRGVRPAAEADRETLARRVTLDLIGLPPTPDEVEAFLNDQRPDAYERLVDRLLGSPHFGERWARWWLDLAHYGDSDGYLQDFLRPVAWRYRQWVIDALNDDLPFDQFTVEQLAGDRLPAASVRQRIGTGFLRNTLSNREGGADLEEFRVKQVLDRTATFGTTWLALTVACAQCHDHKFDPLSQREFYQLYAFFDAANEVNFDAPLPREAGPYERAKAEYDRQRAALLAPIAGPLAELQADWERRILHAEANPGEDFSWDRALELLGLQWGQNLGEGQLEGLNIVKLPTHERTADQRDRLLDYFLANPRESQAAAFQELKLAELKQQLDALARSLPPVTRAPGIMEAAVPRTTRMHVRGDFRRPGDVVEPQTPASLPPLPTTGSPTRLDLARWLVSPEHPLTSRVVVNRLWQELFGRGLVASSDNFGVRGTLPSHPELLDWLAIELVRGGWSLKGSLRQIVNSQTYRQSSAARPELVELDPQNTLVARQMRIRLSGEAVRDAALAVSGELVAQIGGPSVKPPQPQSVSEAGYSNVWEPSSGGDRYRRGIYTFIQRTSPFAQFVTFDLPDLSRSCTRRERSNTPLQALNLLNDPVFIDAARALAGRPAREAQGDDSERLARAFREVLGRPPTTAESTRLREYLGRQREIFGADPESACLLIGTDPNADPNADPAWIVLASVLLNLDEFISRE